MDSQIDVGIMLTHKEAKVPVYKHGGDSGADVYSVSNPDHPDGLWQIRSGHVTMIDLGFKMAIPDGYEIQVRSRSGLSKKGLIVANSPGTIDSGWKGVCKVLMSNITHNEMLIEPGERIAQFVLKKAPRANFVCVSCVGNSERGSKGFGSTGMK